MKSLHANLPLTLLLILIVFFLSTGFWGLDYGRHWDEEGVYQQPLSQTLAAGRIIHSDYRYPQLWYQTALVLAHATTLAGLSKGETGTYRQRISAAVLKKPFLLLMRAVCLLQFALTLVWIYLLVLKWRDNAYEGLLAAALFGLSWEIAYHSRWFTVDAFVIHFEALTLFFLVLFQKKYDTKWLRWAAFSAGLSFGAKYTGLAIFLPVCISIFFLHVSPLRRARLMGEAALIFFAAFALTTPGAFLEPSLFLEGIQYQSRMYNVPNATYAVQPGWQHGLLLLTYLDTVFFSHFQPIAIIFFILALCGIVALFVENKKNAVIFLSFPVMYTCFFSSYSMMIVRQYLIIGLFLSILSAHGYFYIVDHLKKGRKILHASMVFLLIINATWLLFAARSIPLRHDRQRQLVAAARYIDSHSEHMFLLTNTVAGDLQKFDEKKRSNISHDPTRKDQYVMFYLSDKIKFEWTANIRNYIEHWFGAYEVNMNYYPSWWGDDRIMVMKWHLSPLDYEGSLFSEAR